MIGVRKSVDEQSHLMMPPSTHVRPESATVRQEHVSMKGISLFRGHGLREGRSDADKPHRLLTANRATRPRMTTAGRKHC